MIDPLVCVQLAEGGFIFSLNDVDRKMSFEKGGKLFCSYRSCGVMIVLVGSELRARPSFEIRWT